MADQIVKSTKKAINANSASSIPEDNSMVPAR